MFERGIFDFDSFRWIIGDWLMHLSPAENRLIIINAQKKSKQKRRKEIVSSKLRVRWVFFILVCLPCLLRKRPFLCYVINFVGEWNCSFFFQAGFSFWFFVLIFIVMFALCARIYTHIHSYTHKRMKKKRLSMKKQKKKGFSTFCVGFTFSFGSFFVFHYMNLSYFFDLFRRPGSHQAHLSERMGLHTLSGTKGSDH